MMDKSWMKANITTKTFKDGVKSFIDFARVGAIRGEISCPCNKCGHAEWFLVDVVHHHILQHGFLSGYTHWTFHGELDTTPPISQPASVLDTSPVIDDIRGLVRDALGVNSLDLKSEESSESRLEGDIDGDIEGYIEEDIEEESEEDIEEESDEDSEEDIGDKDIRYKKLLEECEKELYPGSKYSNLSFTLRLYHIKCMGGISNKIFSMILELIKDASPHLSSLPSSNNEAKKLTHDLGLGYKKIDACPNDCMLYLGKRKSQQSCHICNASRYKSDVRDENGESSKSHKFAKMAKQLRIFQTGGMIRLFINLSCIYKMFRSKSSLKQLTNKTIQKNASLNGQSSGPRKSKHKRSPGFVEIFEIQHTQADGSYVEDASRNLVVKANKEISRKISELGCPEEEIDNEKRAAIDREVWIDLVGPGGEVLGYGAGVTKSDVTSFNNELRKMRGENYMNSNYVHKLLAQTKSQNSVIESQNRTIASLNKKVEELENMVGGFRDELKLFQTMFQGACGSSDMFFSTQVVSHEGYTVAFCLPLPVKLLSAFAYRRSSRSIDSGQGTFATALLRCTIKTRYSYINFTHDDKLELERSFCALKLHVQNLVPAVMEGKSSRQVFHRMWVHDSVQGCFGILRLSIEGLAECKASSSSEDSLSAKHQRALKDSLSAKPQRATSDERQGWQYPDDPFPFKEEQAELKLFSKCGLGEKTQ
ncbi:tetratricopeptide-like helical domain, DYW domain protein [Tanacetum coccineum]